MLPRHIFPVSASKAHCDKEIQTQLYTLFTYFETVSLAGAGQKGGTGARGLRRELGERGEGES